MNIYYVAGIPYSDELYHHGIKGQKWGLRRYQNEDGSYTAAGKQRYGFLSGAANTVRNAANSIGSGVSSLAQKGKRASSQAYNFISGNQANRVYDKTRRDYDIAKSRTWNESPKVHDIKNKMDTANLRSTLDKRLSSKFRESAQNRSLLDVSGRRSDMDNSMALDRDYYTARGEYTELSKELMEQLRKENEELMKAEQNERLAKKVKEKNTLLGLTQGAANAAKKHVDNILNSVSSAAGNTANNIGRWGSKQIDAGKRLFSKLTERKITVKTYSNFMGWK